jgi:hypothetical protein
MRYPLHPLHPLLQWIQMGQLKQRSRSPLQHDWSRGDDISPQLKQSPLQSTQRAAQRRQRGARLLDGHRLDHDVFGGVCLFLVEEENKARVQRARERVAVRRVVERVHKAVGIRVEEAPRERVRLERVRLVHRDARRARERHGLRHDHTLLRAPQRVRAHAHVQRGERVQHGERVQRAGPAPYTSS